MENDKRAEPVSLRMPLELKTWLRHKAVDNYRSFSNEVLVRLEQSRKDEEAQHAEQA